MRSGLIWLHKYTGLILGLLLSITGLSGSLVVFDRELDEWLTPETVDFELSQTLAPYDVAVAQAKQALGTDAEPTRLMTGRHAGAPHIIRFPTPENAPGPIEVSINPVTGEALAVRNWGQYPVTWFYRLHLSFLGGERGEILVGIMGFCMLFFCISGVIIWWPKLSRQGKRDWWRAFTIKRKAGWFRLNFDLHKTVGIYFLPVFIMLAVTGIEIVWHDPFRQVVATVLTVEEEPSPQSTPLDSPALSMDEAAAAAQQVYPESRIARLYVPANETAPWRVTFIHPDDWWTEYSGTMVYLDQYNGDVLAVWDSRELPLGNKMLAWFFPLHNGDALSLLGRIIVFVAGLLPSLLFGTGVYMWWRKRRGVRR
jgi:uncharacterized iron-regulated membrane protein